MAPEISPQESRSQRIVIILLGILLMMLLHFLAWGIKDDISQLHTIFRQVSHFESTEVPSIDGVELYPYNNYKVTRVDDRIHSYLPKPGLRVYLIGFKGEILDIMEAFPYEDSHIFKLNNEYFYFSTKQHGRY